MGALGEGQDSTTPNDSGIVRRAEYSGGHGTVPCSYSGRRGSGSLLPTGMTVGNRRQKVFRPVNPTAAGTALCEQAADLQAKSFLPAEE